MKSSRIRQWQYLAAAACWVIGFVLLPMTAAKATYSLDRWYRMGDDPGEPATPGQPVGTGAIGGRTYDSKGASGQNNFQDLTPVGSPIYVNISADRPVPANSLDSRAIQFNGTSQYLFGQNLNIPEEADIATGQVENYAGITDRGYQMWVKVGGFTPGVFQVVLDDADRHNARISTDGFWGFQTRQDERFGTIPVVTGAWTHVAQVRPNGDAGGSLGWVNGRAVVSQLGDYTSSSLSLAIGADVEPDTVGGQTFAPTFNGLISEIEMYVLGGSFGAFSYTRDNGYFTDVFLPSTSGYGYSDANQDGHNDAIWVQGDVNFDGVLNVGDITTFIAGWRSTNVETVIGVGPRIGDYLSLGKGDLDLDGDTDVDDWIRLRATGISAGIGAFAAPLSAYVPEPGGGVLAWVAATWLMPSRRRGRRT